MADHPIKECQKTADEWIAKGGVIYQKFTCDGCGNRLTVETPNTFFVTGSCDNCSTITDIEKKGCNYILVINPHRGKMI